MTTPGTTSLEWSPYNSRGTRPRIKEFVTHGDVEYEQCIEGGSYLIRRTKWNDNGQPTVMETGRGMARIRVLGLWKLIASGDAS
ncbi:hypothetical protein [Nonomuraea helvata]|uniref:Uncharacterized protein n=1 Tax=Nonomuraea helvata TaxID=37484 RepID=A0ABV5SAD8_9ACTN